MYGPVVRTSCMDQAWGGTSCMDPLYGPGVGTRRVRTRSAAWLRAFARTADAPWRGGRRHRGRRAGWWSGGRLSARRFPPPPPSLDPLRSHARLSLTPLARSLARSLGRSPRRRGRIASTSPRRTSTRRTPKTTSSIIRSCSIWCVRRGAPPHPPVPARARRARSRPTAQVPHTPLPVPPCPPPCPPVPPSAVSSRGRPSDAIRSAADRARRWRRACRARHVTVPHAWGTRAGGERDQERNAETIATSVIMVSSSQLSSSSSSAARRRLTPPSPRARGRFAPARGTHPGAAIAPRMRACRRVRRRVRRWARTASS